MNGTRLKKYRIMSIEAEKLVHANAVGGFCALLDGKPNLYLYSGIFDSCLETPVIYDAWRRSRLSRKMYFEDDGNDYTTAVINVNFKHACHDFVMADGIYTKYGRKIDDTFFDCAQTETDDSGVCSLVAVKLYKTLDHAPLPNEVLAPYFEYDSENNFYVRRKKSDKLFVPFASVRDVKDIRAELYENGFDCDGTHYVRYKRSAGSSRAGQCLFIAEPLYKSMMKWSLCGLDLTKSGNIDLASFEAYVSLSLSSITDILKLPKNSILFLKDAKSVFNTRAVSVELDGSGKLTSSEGGVEIQNLIWDGEALLDVSVFEESGYADKGMMLLRNRFFKTCAFNTNIQKYFEDNGITDISQLCGYTQATSVSEIKMIVTESSLKYLKLADKKLSFEDKISRWLENIDDQFGIVKTDKPTGFFGGRSVRTSYQLLNTLGLSRDEVSELLRDTLEYYKNVRSSVEYMRNYINYTLSEADDADEYEDIPLFSVRQGVMMDIMSLNDDIANTVIYKEFRKTVLSSFSEKIRGGRLLVNGTNATIFGNGIELLAASVGKFCEGNEAICLDGDRIYSKRFEDGAHLLGCRSPHVTMGNLLYAENRREPLIDKYFNLTNEIVCVNAISNNIQQRLNGCDYDSDTMLLTDNMLMVEAARRNFERFAVPVCSISSTPKAYFNTPADRALLDHEIAQNKIGEIINLSQILNTLYWHTEANYPERVEENRELYRHICILAVLSGMEIDKAKRNYAVATQSVLVTLKKSYPLDKTPEFFNFIMEKKRDVDSKMSYDTTMDYVFTQTKEFTRRLSHDIMQGKSLTSFVKAAKANVKETDLFHGESNDAKDCKALRAFADRSRVTIERLRIEMKRTYGDEKYPYIQRIAREYDELISYFTRKLKNYHILKMLLTEIDENILGAEAEDRKLLWTVFEAACLERKGLLYSILALSRDKDMYNLIMDENGDIDILGVKHTRALAKFAKIE